MMNFNFLSPFLKIMVFLYNSSSLKLISFCTLNTAISRTMKRTIKSYILVYHFLATNQKKLKDDLLNLLRQYFPDYSSNIILVNRFTIGSLFRNKNTLNKGMLSAVVYKYVCPASGAQYVGSTTRSRATRAAEHAGIGVRTGVPLSQPPQSHIRDHLLTCGGPQIALNHFEIIGTCNNNSLELRILESLHIAKIKPYLNCMKSAYPLSLVNFFLAFSLGYYFIVLPM